MQFQVAVVVVVVVVAAVAVVAVVVAAVDVAVVALATCLRNNKIHSTTVKSTHTTVGQNVTAVINNKQLSAAPTLTTTSNSKHRYSNGHVWCHRTSSVVVCIKQLYFHIPLQLLLLCCCVAAMLLLPSLLC